MGTSGNTSKNIAQYLHLYLGCKLFTGTGYVTLVAVHSDSFSGVFEVIVLNGNVTHRAGNLTGIKPILRRLSSMTEHERVNAVSPMNYGLKTLEGDELLLQSAELTRYLLSRGFDLFNLIDDGLAIDMENIKQNVV